MTDETTPPTPDHYDAMSAAIEAARKHLADAWQEAHGRGRSSLADAASLLERAAQKVRKAKELHAKGQ